MRQSSLNVLVIDENRLRASIIEVDCLKPVTIV
jgi:hypothetical protein